MPVHPEGESDAIGRRAETDLLSHVVTVVA